MYGYPWGPLPEPVAESLSQLMASFDTFSGLTLHPAAVVTTEGERHEAVLFVRLSPDEADWAEELARQGRCVQPEDVAEAFESPHRLAPVLANRLYETAAATRSEYRFRVRLEDGASFDAHVRQVVDFLAVPEPYRVEQVTDVEPLGAEGCNGRAAPAAGAAAPVLGPPEFKWCFYIWPRLPGDLEE